LTGNTPPDETKAIQDQMDDPQSNLKLVYVTPEKVAKSKRFMSKLEKLHKAGRLARYFTIPVAY
jgi:ATP-dependent DNA helicase Q1